MKIKCFLSQEFREEHYLDEDLLLQVMSNRSKNEAEKKGDLVQLEYEIKLEVLQAEEKVLKKRLKELG